MTYLLVTLVALLVSSIVGYIYRGLILADLEDAKKDIEATIDGALKDAKAVFKGSVNTVEGRVKWLEDRAKAGVKTFDTKAKNKLAAIKKKL